MNHICNSKHATFSWTLEICPSSGLGLCLLLASLIGLCLCMTRPVTVYLPKGMDGRVICPGKPDPPATVIIWKRNDKFINEQEKLDEHGVLLIDPVTDSDEGNYTCTSYSPYRQDHESFTLIVLVKDLPFFTLRPLPVYQRVVDGSVFMPCVADGDPKPLVTWKKADGMFPPTTKTLHDGGNLTIVHLSEAEQGTYECIAQNEVTSIITTTVLIVRVIAHSSPYNITVEVTESTARISWLPPFIDEVHRYEYRYELWCQSVENGTTSKWQRFDAIPDNATTVTIYNLQPRTSYKFKIMSNYSGKPYFSREVAVRTKSGDHVTMPFPVTITDDEDLLSGDYTYSGSTSLPDRTLIPSPDQRPAPPSDISVRQLNSGVNISWLAPRRSPVPVEYYVVQYQAHGQWVRLSGQIEARQTHYVWSVPSLGTTYHFRVLSCRQNLQSRPSSEVNFTKSDPLSENTRPSGATVGGIITGVVFFVLLFVLFIVLFKAYRLKEKKKRETAFAPTEYASTSINRRLEGRASPILETLSIISNHSQVRNNDVEMRHCHETPI